MPILARMSRLLSADMHAVIDRLEEPAALLAQAIRDMEQELEDDRAQIASLEADEADTRAQLKQASKRIDAMGRELDLCLADGNESLARSIVRRKIAAERITEIKTVELEEIARKLESASARQTLRLAKLAEVREQAEILGAKSTPERRQDSHGDLPDSITNDEVEAALLREKAARSQP